MNYYNPSPPSQSNAKMEAERRIAAKAEKYNAEAKKIKAVTE